MRIGIDATPIQKGSGGGIPRYVDNLLKCFTCDAKTQDEYFLYLSAREFTNQLALQNLSKMAVQKRTATMPWILYKHLGLSRQLRHDKIDLFHSPTPTLPMMKACKYVMTVHEVSYELYPDWYPKRERLYWSLGLGLYAVRNADKIIADSQSTKNDLIRFYKVPKDKVEVIYLGVDLKNFKPVDDQSTLEALRKRYLINGPFILYVGMIFTKRNIPRLLLAFKKLKKKYALPHKLVLAGPTIPGHYIDIGFLAQEFGLSKDIVHINTSFGDDPSLPALYSAAELFVYPSLYEGFGLPLLEAMACATPVITSNVSSMPEVVGDAGITINPYDVDELAKAMYQVLSDENLRSNLRTAGLKRCKTFTWEKTALETLRVYTEVILHQ